MKMGVVERWGMRNVLFELRTYKEIILLVASTVYETDCPIWGHHKEVTSSKTVAGIAKRTTMHGANMVNNTRTSYFWTRVTSSSVVLAFKPIEISKPRLDPNTQGSEHMRISL